MKKMTKAVKATPGKSTNGASVLSGISKQKGRHKATGKNLVKVTKYTR